MSVLQVILTVVFVGICFFLSAVILLQEGKHAGLGSISGMAESYYGKNKSRTMESNLEKMTTVAAVLWMVLALVLNLSIWG